ncbi:MAG: hypothetical protein KDA57_12460 [Planctomycetales bacterium]|nr:hypothetical protein [Planctomycetales bacterium]
MVSPIREMTNTSGGPDSNRRCAIVVVCWCLAIGLLPPNGLLWQIGWFEAAGQWLVNGVLATLDLSGLVR